MEQVGPYTIINEIGRGGMATVYRAQHPAVDHIIALKVLPAHLESETLVVGRFRQEAETAAKLCHNNIVKFWDASSEQPPYYIAMEYLEGGTLANRLAQGPLSIEEAIKVTAQLCDALDYAHNHPQGKVVHRDIKPANIMFDGGGRPVLLDFGIARVADQTRLTADGTKFGTPDYMSPEQAKGLRVDYRSDLYSLAVVFYEMVTLRPPFLNENSLVTMRQIIDEPLPSPREWNPDITPALEVVLTKALAKHPDDRYQSGAGFAQALVEAYHIPVVITPQYTPNTGQSQVIVVPQKTRATRKPMMVATLLAVLLLVCTVVVAIYNSSQPQGGGGGGGGTSTATVPTSAITGSVVVDLPVVVPEKTTIPNLSDKSLALATSILADLSISATPEYKNSDMTIGDVFWSYPEYGTIVDKGSSVTLFISTGPQVAGQNSNNAEIPAGTPTYTPGGGTTPVPTVTAQPVDGGTTTPTPPSPIVPKWTPPIPAKPFVVLEKTVDISGFKDTKYSQMACNVAAQELREKLRNSWGVEIKNSIDHGSPEQYGDGCNAVVQLQIISFKAKSYKDIHKGIATRIEVDVTLKEKITKRGSANPEITTGAYKDNCVGTYGSQELDDLLSNVVRQAVNEFNF